MRSLLECLSDQRIFLYKDKYIYFYVRGKKIERNYLYITDIIYIYEIKQINVIGLFLK